MGSVKTLPRFDGSIKDGFRIINWSACLPFLLDSLIDPLFTIWHFHCPDVYVSNIYGKLYILVANIY